MNDERNMLIYERHKNGETIIALAEEYGVTKQRIHQIYMREEIRRRMNESDDELMKLRYKYAKTLSEHDVLIEIFEDNNIKTIFDLDAASIDDLHVERWNYVPSVHIKRIITQMKNKARKIIEGMS